MPVASVLEVWRYPVKSMAGERLEQSEVGPRGLWGDRGWAVRDQTTGEIHNAKRYPVLMLCSAVYRSRPQFDEIPDVDITFPDGKVLGSDSPEITARLSELMGHPVALHRLRPASDKAFYRRREPGTGMIGALARYRRGRALLGWAVSKGLAGGHVREEFARETDEPLPDMSDFPALVFEYQTPPGTFFDVFPIHVLTTGALRLMSRMKPEADWDVRRFRPNVVVDTGTAEVQVETGWLGRVVQLGGFTIKGEVPAVRCAMPAHPQNGLPADPSILRTIVREADQCLGLYASVQDSGGVMRGDPVQVVM